MEVSTSPLKWKFIRRNPTSRAERSGRLRACVIDYNGNRLVRDKSCGCAASLRDVLRTDSGHRGASDLRIIVVEDLSRDLIELLGERYDIDPRLFRQLLNDNLFYNTRDTWVEVPALPTEDQAKPFSIFSFLRARYYANEQEYSKAERESGMFNVLRRTDSDNTRITLQDSPFDLAGASVSLGRSKAAIWTKVATASSPAIAILWIDPSVTAGRPLWGGIETEFGVLSMGNVEKGEGVQTQDISLFEQITQASSALNPQKIAEITRDVRCAGIPMYKIALKEWLLVIQYMNARVRLTRWRLERPHFDQYLEGLDKLLKKLVPWQRNLVLYENMVKDAMQWHLPHTSNGHSMETGGREALRPDFTRVAEQLQRTRARIDEVVADVATKVAQDQSRREIQARQESRGLTYLSILATVFLPLNFATSFFSMSSDFSTSSNTFWLFFAVGVPLTLAVVAIVGLLQQNVRHELRARFDFRAGLLARSGE